MAVVKVPIEITVGPAKQAAQAAAALVTGKVLKAPLQEIRVPALLVKVTQVALVLQTATLMQQAPAAAEPAA
jgi:hypothetical protein